MLALRPYLPLRMVLTVCGHCFSEDPDREVDYERDILQDSLKSARGNRSKAARLVRTTDRIFNYKVRMLGIDWKRFRG